MTAQHEIQAAIDRGQCIGNGVCVALAPRAFSLDDSLKAVVVAPNDESEHALFAAADACPTQAIYLSTRTGKPLYP